MQITAVSGTITLTASEEGKEPHLQAIQPEPELIETRSSAACRERGSGGARIRISSFPGCRDAVLATGPNKKSRHKRRSKSNIISKI